MSKNNQTAAPPLKGRGFASQLLSGMVAAFSLMVIFSASAVQAAPPPANSVIGNQAVATYNDASGAQQTTLSNLVQTTVLPVGAFTLTPNATKDIIAGQTAYLPHTLTNNGNTADTFSLTFPTINTNGSPTSIIVYQDSNADGVPDDLAVELCHVTNVGSGASTGCSLGSIAGGQAYNFVVAVQSPTTATGTPWEQYILRGTAGQVPTGITYASTTQDVTDTVNIATGAVFDVTKSISVPGGSKSASSCLGTNYAAAGCYKATYTLKYTNNGQATGTIYIKDSIGKPGTTTAGMDYLLTTGRWSSFPATVLVDGSLATAETVADGSGSIVYYRATQVTAATATLPAEYTIEAYVTGVPKNVSGTITFDVGIASNALQGTPTTTNTALFGIATEAPTDTPTAASPSNNSSNPASYNVGLGQVFDVRATNSAGTIATDVANNVATAGSVNEVLQATAVAGQTISFSNYIWNAGDGDDTFDITLCTSASSNANCTVAVSNFPAGTAFQLYKNDGVNPLLDSTGNGIPDTGVIGAGASYQVVVKATIPLNACASGTCPTGPFTIQKIATSVGDSSKYNNVFDRLAAITTPSVDLKNVDAGSSAASIALVNDTLANGGAASDGVITSKNGGPGSTTFFDLFVYNTSAVADSYEMNYKIVTPRNDAAFTTNSAPAGWSVQFRTNPTGAACSVTVGQAVTATDLINGVSGAVYSNQRLCAMVTSPTTAVAGTWSVYFKSTSRTSGASDTKLDQIVLTVGNNGLTLTPSNQGQIYPGGTIVYKHKIDKTGSADCTGLTLAANMDAALLGQGWSALVYKDSNNNGNFDPPSAGGTDVLLTSANNSYTGANLPDLTGAVGSANAQYTLLVQVFAPNGAAVGATDLVTLTATGTCNVASTGTSTDLTTVINGQLRLLKTQALDALCDGTADTAYDTALISAKPGACILYRIEGINEGIADISDVVINDTTPVFTTSTTPAASCSGAGMGAATGAGALGNGNTGAVTCASAAGTKLAPGGKDTMNFAVKINP